jgi:hypothetical protein
MVTSNIFVPVELSQPDVVETRLSVRSRSVSTIRRVVKEPLVHFLLLGALLFLYSHSKGDAGPGSYRIVISRGEVEHLSSGFIRTWQRAPTQSELKGLMDDYVKEEIATREAMAMGLDRNDAIIRRRLRQKVEFLADDTASAGRPTDKELQAWLERHPGAFASEPEVAFEQVYINPSAHGQGAEAEARQVLTLLKKGGPSVSRVHVGDASLLPSDQPLSPLSETSRAFGDEFANNIMKLRPGEWSGPVESSFGLHLVFVRQRVAAVPAKLDEIRPEVEREVLQEKRKSQLDALYQDLLKKYSVTIDWPKEDAAAAEVKNMGTRP